jgi:hypothetical protein
MLASFLEGRICGKPIAVGYWFCYDDTSLHLLPDRNTVRWRGREIAPVVREVVVASASDVEKDYQRYAAMNKGWRDDLQRAMARFIASQTRHELADRVLDQTIAYEIVVAEDGDRQNQVGLGWKVSVRTALILGEH